MKRHIHIYSDVFHRSSELSAYIHAVYFHAHTHTDYKMGKGNGSISETATVGFPVCHVVHGHWRGASVHVSLLAHARAGRVSDVVRHRHGNQPRLGNCDVLLQQTDD